jgi:hypothetical protein
MAPPDDGNVHIPFTELMALDIIDTDTFRGKSLAFAPASGKRTYGGHVYSQSCYSASQTVSKEMVLHVRTLSQFHTSNATEQASSLLLRFRRILRLLGFEVLLLVIKNSVT